jgi:hypothetical protein
MSFWRRKKKRKAPPSDPEETTKIAEASPETRARFEALKRASSLRPPPPDVRVGEDKTDTEADTDRKTGELQLDYEDVTGVIDLTLEEVKSTVEHCQEKAREAVDKLSSIAPPKPEGKKP